MHAAMPVLGATLLLLTAAPPSSEAAAVQAQTDQQSRQKAAHDDHGPQPDPARIHSYAPQEVVVPDFAAEGYVLDIGGGGEGVIGQLKPRQVVAIDLSARELLGAPAGPLKIVMDATDLKFLDDTFQTATSFFTLMYMKADVQERALREVHRVLAPGGRLLVWDVILPARFDPVKDIAVFALEIQLPDRKVSTGYGTRFPAELHDVAYFVALAGRSGFEVTTQQVTGRTFFLELRKPSAPPSSR